MATTRTYTPWSRRIAAAGGNAAVEYVAAAALLATIVAGVIAVLPGSAGAPIARSVGDAVTKLVREAKPTPRGLRTSYSAHSSGIRTRGQWDARTQPRPQLRPPQMAWRSATHHGARTSNRGSHQWNIRGCVLCAGVEASQDADPAVGASTSSLPRSKRHATSPSSPRRGKRRSASPSRRTADGSQQALRDTPQSTARSEHNNSQDSHKQQGGLDLGGHVLGWLSVIRVDASHTATFAHRSSRVRFTHRGHAHVGADASLEAGARLTKSKQEIGLEAGAVAGAVGRVEHRTAVRVAGIGLDATVGAEGWAGAGARAGVHLAYQRGGVWRYHANMGAALGLGGAVRVSGTVDLRSLLARPRAP